jgi:YidC/Oxa1 family membrane protein insertase
MSYAYLLPRRMATAASTGASLGVALTPLYVVLAAILAGMYAWSGSYATMLIGLGAGITVLSTPLSASLWRSQVARVRLAPKLDELKRKHATDRSRLASETAALFQQHGVSPWAGCLPALVPAPIYLGLYRVIKGLTNRPVGTAFFRPRYLSHSSRLFRTLASSTTMHAWGVNLASTGVAAIQVSAASAGLFLGVVVVTVAAGIWQQQLVKKALAQPTQSTPTTANTLTALVPVLFAVWGLVLPLAVTLYYASASLVRLAQQWAFVRFHPI